LRPASDLDVLAVATRRTTRPERRRLVDGLLRLSKSDGSPGPGRRVELTILVQSEVRPFRLPTRFDFQFGNWLRDEFARGDLEPWPAENPDVAVLITMALLANRPLLGPVPTALLDPVPHHELTRAIVIETDRLLADLASDTRNVLLTLARIWSTVETGAIRSKDAAADWALARLPDEHRAVLERAQAIYLGEAAERWDDLAEGIWPLADYLATEIRGATGS
ncbi:MAG: DUF4111 domain-containing protein, partial [Chloroflexi bacterium]|nr:DUF4111 domain-containing protein [Chloroflexota bacterium]